MAPGRVADCTCNPGLKRFVLKPSKFIAHQERRLKRPLSDDERNAITAARERTTTGQTDTIKAMWKALDEAPEPDPSNPREKPSHLRSEKAKGRKSLNANKRNENDRIDSR